MIALEDLMEILDFAFKNNVLEFNDEVKIQKSWTGIGTKFAHHYACIFMNAVEAKFLASQNLQPFLWFRYIDVMFFIWTPEKKKPFSFLINYANFLDLKISLGNGAIHTDLCIKPTDSHQYLHYQLSHAQHTKVSIPYSQA